MLDDLQTLLGDGRIELSRDQLLRDVEIENVLGKPSAQSRKLAARHLVRLYALDRSVPLYRAFAFLWEREREGRPLLALLVAYVRDAELNSSAPFIFEMKAQEPFDRESLESFLEGLQPGRFSRATLRSVAQNIAGSWTQSGHLQGRRKKARRMVDPTPASVAFALLLGHVTGRRGQLLFESPFVKLLDCQPARAIELAESAAGKGWIRFKRIGSIMEVSFPRLLEQQETEVVVEQN